MITKIALGFFIVSTISLAISYVLLLKQLTKTSEALAKLIIISDFLTNATNPSQDQEDLDTSKESFIKFLSESRDWAFEYIEEVQTNLQEFVDKVSPDIDYFDQYGVIGSGPENDALKRISKAFKELKRLLPEEEK